MATADSDDRQRLDRWLSLIRGPALVGPMAEVWPRRAQAIAEMRAAGWSPSVRLFEAAACGVPVISDWWQGLDEIRILMGDDVTKRTHKALVEGSTRVKRLLDSSIPFNRHLLLQLNERLGQFIATVEFDRLLGQTGRDPGWAPLAVA